MKKIRLQKFFPLMIMLPAVAIGAIAMNHNSIPTLIWAQNVACLAIFGLISFFVISEKFEMGKSKFNSILMIISLILLILTLINPGMDGVHRWVSVGRINFNVSMIVLPIIIIELWKLSQIKDLWVSIVITMSISILLIFQPDASQLTGFAVPMMIMLCSKTDKKSLRVFIVGMLSLLIILSWAFLDSLPAVAYVERIVNLLANMGLVWLAIGVISLVILPIPFIIFPPKNLKLPSIYVGIYFMIIIISTLFGNFPVPLMGYGISPIIGYCIAITWYTIAKINS